MFSISGKTKNNCGELSSKISRFSVFTSLAMTALSAFCNIEKIRAKLLKSISYDKSIFCELLDYKIIMKRAENSLILCSFKKKVVRLRFGSGSVVSVMVRVRFGRTQEIAVRSFTTSPSMW